MPRLAEEADAHWSERIENVLPGSTEHINFQGIYNDIYDQYAEFDHPSTLGLQVFVHISAGHPHGSRSMAAQNETSATTCARIA